MKKRRRRRRTQERLEVISPEEGVGSIIEDLALRVAPEAG